MRVCLIVDNPLRDLDGLVMLAWQLARRGATSYLVPMYEQGFDVAALGPDVVVANYVRPNNRDLLIGYRNAGMRIAVLDTEGAGGKNADQLARMVARMDCAGLVDLYCVWGEQQFDAFTRAQVVPPPALRLTGCPRYDFCAPPWIAALPEPKGLSGYVLINTNFPTVNPRFSRSVADEVRAMVQTGFDPEFARQFIHDARAAHEAVKAAISALTQRFPDTPFVIRPHPFERVDPYSELGSAGNVHVRQEGTSLEWLNRARFLIHQNCSTAVEAVMLGRNAVSLEWFNTDALRLEGPSAVSFPAKSQGALEAIAGDLLGGAHPRPSAHQVAAQASIIRDLYFANDGRAAERVADALLEITENSRPKKTDGTRRSVRTVAVATARRALGHRVFARVRRMLHGPDIVARREAKTFALEQVQAILDRITRAAGQVAGPRANIPRPDETTNPSLSSGTTIRIERLAG